MAVPRRDRSRNRRSEFAIPSSEIIVETNAGRDESEELIRRRADPRLSQMTWH